MERFFKQAWETVFLKFKELKHQDTINAFNYRVNDREISPTLTTRPDGFKTAICVVEIYEEN